MNINDYDKLLKKLGCMNCGTVLEIQNHHPRCLASAARKSGEWCKIPLCRDCHLDGAWTVHNSMLDEKKLLDKTIKSIVMYLSEKQNNKPF